MFKMFVWACSKMFVETMSHPRHKFYKTSNKTRSAQIYPMTTDLLEFGSCSNFKSTRNSICRFNQMFAKKKQTKWRQWRTWKRRSLTKWMCICRVEGGIWGKWKWMWMCICWASRRWDLGKVKVNVHLRRVEGGIWGRHCCTLFWQ